MGGDGHKHKGGANTHTWRGEGRTHAQLGDGHTDNWRGGDTNTQTREVADTGTILMHIDTHGHTDTHTHTNTHTILRLSSI